MRQASRARRAAQVAALTVGPEYNAPFVRLYKIFILQLREVVPPNTHLPAAYDAGGCTNASGHCMAGPMCRFACRVARWEHNVVLHESALRVHAASYLD